MLSKARFHRTPLWAGRTLAGLILLTLPAFSERITISLDGEWRIADSVSPDEVPASLDRRVPVPGLANLARPTFADVDLFDSREVIWNRVRRDNLPRSELTDRVGIPRQTRNYFWYEKTFTLDTRKEIVILKINKAQFGTAVWLNGTKIGEHLGCFTAGYFDLTDAVNWGGRNALLVRVGAHPAALPESVLSGTDFEKTKWTPGIYDSVSLLLSDNPVIETIQVAPRIQGPEILVQTRIRNHGGPRATELTQQVREWKSAQVAARAPSQRLRLAAGEERVVTQTIPIRGAKLWSPEDPALYVLETSTGGDSVSTRFGMREFRFDTATGRAYLNGKICFLRGSNITLHRFFEDPDCGSLPWDEGWVRKLLADIPKRMHWNSFRFCIGPVPDKWLEIADEAGLLIQNEFFVWTGRDRYHNEWDVEDMIRQYKGWMRDNWNHPSVVIWDSNNETIADVFGEKIIPSVRSLDLSNRPWENGYNLPVGPDDPVEDHPYLFSREFKPESIERMTGAKSTNSARPSAHAAILNEYGWLWLNRDGTPTKLTQGVYDSLLGPNATPEERFALNAELLAGLTEFWRAHRNFAGVLHFVYLTASFPGAYTADHFRDVRTLTLEPHFEDYVGEAFKPLGVYLNFWRRELKAGAAERLAVMMINDYAEPVKGRLVLSLEDASGRSLLSREGHFELPALGQQTYSFDISVPSAPGQCLLKATAFPDGGPPSAPTVSRRRLSVTAN